MELDNFAYPRLGKMTTENIRAYRNLIGLSIAVRTYMINPTLPMNVEAMKEAYNNYIPSKKKIEVPEGWKNFEKGLIKQTGGILTMHKANIKFPLNIFGGNKNA